MKRSINNPRFFEFCDQSVEKFGKWGFIVSAVCQSRDKLIPAANYVRINTTYSVDVAVDVGETYLTYKTVEQIRPARWWYEEAHNFFYYAWPVILKNVPDCAKFLHQICFGDDFIMAYMAIHAIKSFSKVEGHYVDTTPIDDQEME